MIDHELDRRALRALRRNLAYDKWDPLADVIARDRQDAEAHLKATEPSDSLLELLPVLRLKSFVMLPKGLENHADVKAFFEIHPVHKGPHVDNEGLPMPFEVARQKYPMAGYRPDFVLRAPGLIDRFNDPHLLGLIEAFLGCVPTLYSLNAWWTFPAPSPAMPNVQFFHRDLDDWRFVTLFTYLTDVDDDGGPHQIVPGSHTVEGMRALLPSWWKPGGKYDVEKSFSAAMGVEFSAEVERVFGRHAVDITGPAGTMFLANTVALHRGLVPTSRPRLLIWARYGFGPNSNSADIQGAPVSRSVVPTSLPDDSRHRYINRLLFT